jgi:hypothetical protein
MVDAIIGRVLRASTVGFACGTRSGELDLPTFGAFVRTQDPIDTRLEVIGLIYAIQIDDDPLVRQLIMANHINPQTIRDQRENRMVPVEMSIVNIGFRVNGESYHNLPPRPPISLDPVYLCDSECITQFTEQLDFFRLVLNTSAVPAEELIAAAIRYAATARSAGEQSDFLVKAGRRLVTLLGNDLVRLNHVLRLIRPNLT